MHNTSQRFVKLYIVVWEWKMAKQIDSIVVLNFILFFRSNWKHIVSSRLLSLNHYWMRRADSLKLLTLQNRDFIQPNSSELTKHVCAKEWPHFHLFRSKEWLNQFTVIHSFDQASVPSWYLSCEYDSFTRAITIFCIPGNILYVLRLNSSIEYIFNSDFCRNHIAIHIKCQQEKQYHFREY